MTKIEFLDFSMDKVTKIQEKLYDLSKCAVKPRPLGLGI